MVSIHDYADKVFTAEISDLISLTEISGDNNFIHARSTWVKSWFLKHGIDNVTIDSMNNVLVNVNRSDKRPILLFSAHLDTVFSKDTTIKVRSDNDYMYAPGIGDDSANVIGLMYAAKYILKNRIENPYHIMFAFVSGEEGLGNLCGTKYIFESYKSQIAAHIAYDLYIPQLITEAVGSLRVKIDVNTCGGHSLKDFGSPNAIEVLSQILINLKDCTSLTSNILTHNIGTIEGGTSINSIASRARATYEYRSKDQENLEYAKTYIEDTLEKYRSDSVKTTYEIIGIRPGNMGQDQKLELLKECLYTIVYDSCNKTPLTEACSTDANIALSKGIPAACLGAIEGGLLHTEDEYIKTQSLKSGLILIIKSIIETSKIDLS